MLTSLFSVELRIPLAVMFSVPILRSYGVLLYKHPFRAMCCIC